MKPKKIQRTGKPVEKFPEGKIIFTETITPHSLKKDGRPVMVRIMLNADLFNREVTEDDLVIDYLYIDDDVKQYTSKLEIVRCSF